MTNILLNGACRPAGSRALGGFARCTLGLVPYDRVYRLYDPRQLGRRMAAYMCTGRTDENFL